jgi:UDP-N-acetylglucosamine 4-epimerase
MSCFEKMCAQLLKKPSKWLVTGVAGFIGSNLLEALLELDQYVVGLDNFITGYPQNIEDVKDRVGPKRGRFEFIQGDIRNLDDCRRACEGVDYVLHQAALGSVPRSIDDPLTTNTCNVDGFLNMLVAARETRVRRFVFASSSSVYGDSPKLPKIEEELGNPLSPYAASKLINEVYATAFSKAYDFGWIGLRYFNVFGKRQDPNGAYAAVIPRWIDTLIRGESPVVNGDGLTSRDFCYIKDVIQSNILAATAENEQACSKAYNVACGKRTSLNELLAIIKTALVGRGFEVDAVLPVYGPFRKGDVLHSLADIARAKNLLGFEPAYSVETGMQESIDWYVKNSKPE